MTLTNLRDDSLISISIGSPFGNAKSWVRNFDQFQIVNGYVTNYIVVIFTMLFLLNHSIHFVTNKKSDDESVFHDIFSFFFSQRKEFWNMKLFGLNLLSPNVRFFPRGVVILF